MSKELIVKSNADGLGVAKGMTVIDSVDVGDYQGQTVVLLDDDINNTVHIYVIGYGSCGGCDWYEDFYGSSPTYKDCLEAWQDEKARLILPKADLPTAEKLFEYLHDKDSGYQGMNTEYGWTVEAAQKLLTSVTTAASPEVADSTEVQKNA